MQIETLEDGTEAMYFTLEREEQPSRYGIVLTPEMKRAIIDDWVKMADGSGKIISCKTESNYYP